MSAPGGGPEHTAAPPGRPGPRPGLSPPPRPAPLPLQPGLSREPRRGGPRFSQRLRRRRPPQRGAPRPGRPGRGPHSLGGSGVAELAGPGAAAPSPFSSELRAPPDWLGPLLSSPFRPPACPLPPSLLLLPPPAEPSRAEAEPSPGKQGREPPGSRETGRGPAAPRREGTRGGRGPGLCAAAAPAPAPRPGTRARGRRLGITAPGSSPRRGEGVRAPPASLSVRGARWPSDPRGAWRSPRTQGPRPCPTQPAPNFCPLPRPGRGPTPSAPRIATLPTPNPTGSAGRRAPRLPAGATRGRPARAQSSQAEDPSRTDPGSGPLRLHCPSQR